MASSNFMNEGLTLMIFGMGGVFIFLTLLVIFTILMSWLIGKYDEKFYSHEIDSNTTPVTKNTTDQTSLLAILATAVHQYRSKHK